MYVNISGSFAIRNLWTTVNSNPSLIFEKHYHTTQQNYRWPLRNLPQSEFKNSFDVFERSGKLKLETDEALARFDVISRPAKIVIKIVLNQAYIWFNWNLNLEKRMSTNIQKNYVIITPMPTKNLLYFKI